MKAEESGDRTRLYILPCSGESYLAQLAHGASRELVQKGEAELVDLSEIKTWEQAERLLQQRERLVIVDGCEKGCVRGLFEGYGLSPELELVLTDLGLEDVDELELRPEDLTLAMDGIIAAAAVLKDQVPVLPGCWCR